MSAELRLKYFDITSIKSTHTVVLLGKRDTGKSTVAKDILFYHRDMPMGTVICPTEPVNPTYSKFIPSIFVHDEYDAAIVDKLMQRQRKVKNLIMEQEAKYSNSDIDSRVFLIMDDCGADADAWAKSKQIRNLFMNGRHSNVLVLITMQYPMGIPPTLRSNIDFVFILRENVMSNRRRIWENYAGIFRTFDLFCEVMDQCTENYEMLVICNNSKSNTLTDSVFWYKAEPHPPFRMCSEQFWEMDAEAKVRQRQAAESAKEKGEDSEGMLDLDRLTRKRNSPTVMVKKMI